uniref:Uncharacterized protein n=1 Tax=Candidatus Kentrum sp. TC TaxID=2126339 RepID=A0A450Z2X8_9GAMM|nr:MAG: hypothetical protein BECKTC1821E_GA0114239_11044 [Candidatus Kentron sp. TC]VFK50739.1 MAG: hypothetical protein BECKTC1821D_GA0114238_11186 [Candidatus Kentron sp. TC]VFK63829.1 MAG: hypothetical protein BECKTC1821F_GA0114240_11077 [Candidatus Kentron sp. TC]
MKRGCITPIMKENPATKRGGHRSHKLLVAMTPFADVISGVNSYSKLLPRSANHKKAGFRVTGD